MTSEETRQAEQLRASVRALVRRFALAERADVSCCGLTVAQAATLEALGRLGPQRLGALGECLGITASTLTRNLARLEDAGLVRREADPQDGRAQRVALSAAGRKAAAEVERQEQGFALSVLALVPDERRGALVTALGDLLAAVRQATERCCPGAFDHLMGDFPGAETTKEGCGNGCERC